VAQLSGGTILELLLQNQLFLNNQNAAYKSLIFDNLISGNGVIFKNGLEGDFQRKIRLYLFR